MASQPRFEPKWPNEPNDEGVVLPDDKEARTPHPPSAPEEVFGIISSTYRQRQKPREKLSEFTLFPKLSLELRRIIWRYSLPGRRVVEVFYNDETGECTSPCALPAALHVSSEARGVALESYQLLFATRKANAKIYFDVSVDALFLGVGNFSPSGEKPARTLFQAFRRKDRACIQELIINEEIQNFYLDVGKTQKGLYGFGLDSLQSLTIVDDYGNHDIVVHENENNEGEFHAWFILNNGKAVPWRIPERNDWDWSGFVSVLWAATEKCKWDGDINLTTLRYVSRERLKQEKMWERRLKFLEQVVFGGGYNLCLYPRDGVMDRILDMENDQPEMYSSLHDFLGLDPEWVYTTKNPCSCPIGHKHQETPDPGDEDTIEVREALAVMDLAEEEQMNRLIQQIPGSLRDEQTSPPGPTLLTPLPIPSPPLQTPSFLAPVPAPAEDTSSTNTISNGTSSSPSHSSTCSQTGNSASESNHSSSSDSSTVLPLLLSVKATGSPLWVVSLGHICYGGVWFLLGVGYLVSVPFVGLYLPHRELLRLEQLLFYALFFAIDRELERIARILYFGFLLPLRALDRLRHLLTPRELSSFIRLAREKLHSIRDDSSLRPLRYLGRTPSLSRLSSPNWQRFQNQLVSLGMRLSTKLLSQLKKFIPYTKTTSSGQEAPLQRNNPFAKTLADVRRRTYMTYYVCISFWIWLLLVLISITLAFSMLKFMVELFSVLLLIVGGMWLLELWLRVQEAHHK